MNLKKFVKSLDLAQVIKGKSRLGKTDLGVLKVAFMVAALDGEVTEDEYEVFEALAKSCRGYTPENAAKALDEAMHSAGYLMLLAARVKPAELVAAFVREAEAALPNGFAYFEMEDVRRAFVTWIAMGLGDGDYSPREKACIEALRKRFAQLKVDKAEMDYERAMSLSPAFRAAYAEGGPTKTLELVSKRLSDRLQNVLAALGDSEDGEKRLKEILAAK